MKRKKWRRIKREDVATD